MKRVNIFLSFAFVSLLLLGSISCSRSTNSMSLSGKKDKDRYSIREDIFNKASATLKGDVKFIRENRPSISYDEHVVWGFVDVIQPSDKRSKPNKIVFDLSQKAASQYIESISIYQTNDLELDSKDKPLAKHLVVKGDRDAKINFDRHINFTDGKAKLIVSIYLRSDIPEDTNIELDPKGFFFNKGRSIYAAKMADSHKPRYIPLVYTKSTPLAQREWKHSMYNVAFIKLNKEMTYRRSQIEPSVFSHVFLSDFRIATDNSIFLARKGSFIIDQAELINSLHQKGVRVYINLVAGIDRDDQFRLDYFTSLLSDENHMTEFALSLKDMLNRNNLDGVNINFKSFKETGLNRKEHLCRFIQVLNTTFKEQSDRNLSVTASVTTDYRAWDYDEIAKSTEFVTASLYGFSRKFSSPLNIVKKRVKELYAKGVPPNKLVPIFPLYGNRWVVNKMNDRHLMLVGYIPMKFHKVYEGGEAVWHEKEQCYTYDYKDDKDWIRVYAEDQKSISAKLKFVNEEKLLGFGWFNIGNEAPDQAEMLTNLFEKYNEI
ncbi:glycoside hydrolase family 18 protein [Halosquirtibacter laminarini]|uniref:Glycoside hydrolase family 18 protein n=1 Tax=Halosquirtibacter laminarini TaxID=3374600 RepID=A0AC61NBV6_9BACT|nr:glycoside hydrolase family 18 protein [Prolixibacteraceae bacterium]